MKDLKLQETSFQLRDCESRITEFEQKEGFYKSQIDKLTNEVTTLETEMSVMKNTHDVSLRTDT